MSGLNSIQCISVSYKNTSADIRGKLAFPQEIQSLFLKQAVENGASQCVLLCTCNRTEVYFCGDESIIIKLLSDHSGLPVTALTPHLMRYSGKRAVVHLYKVACGIESIAVGEDEILGQTKNAYAAAKEADTAAYEMNTAFLGAISCAKKIKTETMMSKTSVSIATLAANAAAGLGEKVDTLVIGATGRIGTILLKNLASHKNINVYATLRNHSAELSELKSGGKIKTVDYAERYKYIDRCACVISATSAPHFTVTAQGMEERGVTPSDRLFIDLAVPSDIEKAGVEATGGRYMGIDHFERLAEENNALKQDSVEAAKLIINKKTDELFKDYALKEFMPYMETAAEKYESKGLDRIIFKLKKDLDGESFSAVLGSLRTDGGDD